MKYLFVFLFGIFIGWKLNPQLNAPPKVKISTVEMNGEEPSSQKSAKIEIETVEENHSESAQENLPTSTTSASVASQDSVPTQAAISKIKAELSEKLKTGQDQFSKLSINLSEEQVKLLEQNLNELRETTSTLYKDGGWTVRFHDQKNFLRLIGIRDSDFIRFESLEKLKDEIGQKDLAYRFEKILQTLEE